MHTYIHTCMHACIHTYIHTYVHTYIRTYVHTYIRTYVHTYIRTYVHTYIRTYVHTYIRTYIHAYMHTYLHTYILTYLHTYIHTYLHTYIHTYLHTYILTCNDVRFGDGYSQKQSRVIYFVPKMAMFPSLETSIGWPSYHPCLECHWWAKVVLCVALSIVNTLGYMYFWEVTISGVSTCPAQESVWISWRQDEQPLGPDSLLAIYTYNVL